jgi:hypothetical protein
VENSIQESRNAEEKAKKAITDVSITLQRWQWETRKRDFRPREGMARAFHLF